MLAKRHAAHHDNHGGNQQDSRLPASGPERAVCSRCDEEGQNGEHRALQRHHHERINPPKGRRDAIRRFLPAMPEADHDRAEHAGIEHEAVPPACLLSPDLDGVDVKEAGHTKDQGKPADNLKPLGDRCEHQFGGRVRNIVLRGKQNAGDKGNEQRKLAPQEGHFQSFTRSSANEKSA